VNEFLAGPTWQKIPQGVFQNNSALIIALDLSPSMRAEDNTPSRIRRAHLKIQSLLERRQEGLTALLAYAGEAHIVSPFTDDTNTISNLLPTLVPGLLPIPGSNTEMAISLAAQQLDSSGIAKASLLLVTDGVSANALETINQQWDQRLNLTILGLGTDSGATIPSNDGGYLRDTQGEFILAKRDSTTLKKLASLSDGYYLPLQANDSDIDFIEQVIERDFLAFNNALQANNNTDYDQWYEFGPMLLLLSLPFLALAFRRGWLLCVFFASSSILFLNPQTAHASLWDNLWSTKDQQAYKAWQAEDYEKAAELFNDKKWQGSAAYNNNDFEAAVEAFKDDNSATGYYNQGNALAKSGEVEKAISAYEQALKLNPEFTEAQKNKQFLEQQQKRQEEQQQNNEQSDSQSSQNNQQQNDSSDNRDENNNSQQDQEESQNNKPRKEDGEPAEDNTDTTAETNEQKEETQEQNSAQESGEISLPDDLTQEEQQAMRQWLRKIPDDPSGLLRRKFEYEFNQRRQLYQQGKWALPDNNAHERY